MKRSKRASHSQLSGEFAKLATLFRQSQPGDYDWDGSEASLDHLDAVIDELWDGETPDDLETLTQAFGGYVASVVQAHFPGSWTYTPAEGVRFVVEGENPVEFNPFAWVEKRFVAGVDDSIAYKYQVMKAASEGRLPGEP